MKGCAPQLDAGRLAAQKFHLDQVLFQFRDIPGREAIFRHREKLPVQVDGALREQKTLLGKQQVAEGGFDLGAQRALPVRQLPSVGCQLALGDLDPFCALAGRQELLRNAERQGVFSTAAGKRARGRFQFQGRIGEQPGAKHPGVADPLFLLERFQFAIVVQRRFDDLRQGQVLCLSERRCRCEETHDSRQKEPCSPEYSYSQRKTSLI